MDIILIKPNHDVLKSVFETTQLKKKGGIKKKRNGQNRKNIWDKTK